MTQVVEQVGQTAHQALAAGIEQLLDRLGVEQRIARRQCVVDQIEQKVRAGAVIVVQVAFFDPQPGLFLPGQVRLQAAAVERVLGPGRVVEARVAGIRLVRRVAQHHPAQLSAQGQQVAGGVQRVAHAMAADLAQGRDQVATAQAEDRVLHIHAGGGKRCRSFGRFVFHGNTPWSYRFRFTGRIAPAAALSTCCRAGMHDGALTLLLEELHDDRGDGFCPGDQEQVAVVDYV
ncbi:hypothetical protein D3C81_1230130 [compost metagenome]